MAVVVQVEHNLDSLVSALAQLGDNINAALQFLGPQLGLAIRHQIFPALTTEIARSAGGFPDAYLEHLINFMEIEVPVTASAGPNGLVVTVNFGVLGDKAALTLGYHDHALIGERYQPVTEDGEGENEGNWVSVHIGHEGDSAQSQIILPYRGEKLMNPKGVRQAFWNRVIIGRDVEGYISSHFKGKGLQAAMRNKILVDIPTYEDIAERRVAAWVEAGVAPEWLLLQYGSAKSGSAPVIRPADFLGKMLRAIRCSVQLAVDQIIQTIMKVFDREAAAGNLVKVGVGGRPYSAATGQFVKFADIRANYDLDVTRCIYS